MKICAILHKVGKETPKELQRKVVTAFYDHPNIIIGPDYALNLNPKKISPYNHYNQIISEFEGLSARHPACLIIPGTILHQINEKEVVCEAPVFWNGKLQRQLWKNSDNRERKLAEKNNLVYRRGSHKNKQFQEGFRKIAVEICGDHGRQDVRGCDLEIILAYDNKAGFWLNASNDNFKRKIILCDGYAPKIEAWDYDPKIDPRIKEIKLTEGKVFEFDI